MFAPLRPAGFMRSSAITIRTIIRHRKLTWELVKREIVDRYAGQFFGSFWAIAHPILVVSVFLFLFGTVLRLRIGQGDTGVLADYTVYLVSGLVPWLTLQEAIAKGPTIIVNQASLVKQVAFPLEVLPIKSALPALLTLGVGQLILMLYSLFVLGFFPWTYLLMPFLWAILITLMIGLSYMLSAIGVFFRDLKDFVQILVFLGIYTSPILFTIEAVPEQFQPIIYLNPFTYLVLCFHDVSYHGAVMHPYAWFISLLLSLAVFFIGVRLFDASKLLFGSHL